VTANLPYSRPLSGRRGLKITMSCSAAY